MSCPIVGAGGWQRRKSSLWQTPSAIQNYYKTKVNTKQKYTKCRHITKKDYPLWLLPSSQRCKNIYIYISINVIISLLKDKNLTIISICTKKLLIKSNVSLCVKIPRKSRTEGNRPQHNKGYIWKTHSQQHPKWWKHGSSPLKSVIRQGCLWSLILFNANFEPYLEHKQEKETNRLQIRNKEVKLSQLHRVS